VTVQQRAGRGLGQIGTLVTEGAGTGSLPYVLATAEYRAVGQRCRSPGGDDTSTSVTVRFRIVVTPTAARIVAKRPCRDRDPGTADRCHSIEFRVFQRTSTGWSSSPRDAHDQLPVP
jgi:hypothetical protein